MIFQFQLEFVNYGCIIVVGLISLFLVFISVVLFCCYDSFAFDIMFGVKEMVSLLVVMDMYNAPD